MKFIINATSATRENYSSGRFHELRRPGRDARYSSQRNTSSSRRQALQLQSTPQPRSSQPSRLRRHRTSATRSMRMSPRRVLHRGWCSDSGKTSVSLELERKYGWKGLLVEPNPGFYEATHVISEIHQCGHLPCHRARSPLPQCSTSVCYRERKRKKFHGWNWKGFCKVYPDAMYSFLHIDKSCNPKINLLIGCGRCRPLVLETATISLG